MGVRFSDIDISAGTQGLSDKVQGLSDKGQGPISARSLSLSSDHATPSTDKMTAGQGLGSGPGQGLGSGPGPGLNSITPQGHLPPTTLIDSSTSFASPWGGNQSVGGWGDDIHWYHTPYKNIQ